MDDGFSSDESFKKLDKDIAKDKDYFKQLQNELKKSTAWAKY